MNRPKLTATAEQILKAVQKDIAVVAGPGSGKTTILVERIHALIARGVPASKIACITFTNNAAREIEKRLAMYNPDNPPALGYCGTIHGYMLTLVKQFHGEINMPASPAVLSEAEAKTLLEDTAAELRVKEPKKNLRAAIEKGPAKFLGPDVIIFDKADRVALAYFQKCWGQGTLDFDTILSAGIMVLEKQAAEIGMTDLLWDEFQDSGSHDFRILALLANLSRFIVGDPDQSIYQFRGAKPQQFTAWARQVAAQGAMFTMETNFRCAPAICAMANRLIHHNKQRIPKQTVPNASDTAGEIQHRHFSSDSEEIAALAMDIAKRPFPEECAVLLRTNALLTKYRLLLRGSSVPVVVEDATSVPETFEQTLAFMNLIANRSSDYVAYRYITLRYGKETANRDRGTAASMLKPLHCLVRELPPEYDPEALLEQLARAGTGGDMIELVKAARSNLRENCTLLELIAECMHYGSGPRTDEKIVWTSTYHGAKGCEFDHVYLPAFEEGIIPSKSKNADIEEERRLAFVGITRARRSVWISHVERRAPQYGRQRPEPANPSRFVGEIFPTSGM